MSTLDTLKGWGDEWSTPIESFQTDMVIEDFDKIISACDIYVRYLYVKDLNVTAP